MNKIAEFCVARPLDSLGRVVIPKEMRKLLEWNESDNIFIGIKDGMVYMSKFSNICPICRNPHDYENTLNICEKCVSEIMASVRLE